MKQLGKVEHQKHFGSGFLLNVDSPGRRMGSECREMVKAIEANMSRYIQILLEVGVPGTFLRCLDIMDSKDLARPVAFLAKMVAYRPLALQLVREGLLSSNLVERVLGGLSPKEVMLDYLMIVSDLARMSKDFYDSIDKAALLGYLKDYLCSEDADLRSKACSAIGNMCRHSDHFYKYLAIHEIVDLLIDRCADPDKRARKFACFAVQFGRLLQAVQKRILLLYLLLFYLALLLFSYTCRFLVFFYRLLAVSHACEGLEMLIYIPVANVII